MSYTYPFEMASLSCDIIVLKDNDDEFTFNNPLVLLIERGADPYKGCLALPGGFIERTEHIKNGVIRELKEETNIDANPDNVEFLFFMDEPYRDIRQRTISFVHLVHLYDSSVEVTAGDDAKSFKWVHLSDLLDYQFQLAFDHQQMINRLFLHYNHKL